VQEVLCESVMQARWSAAGAVQLWGIVQTMLLLSSSFCELLSKESVTCMCCIALEGETFPAALK
jgi:hypothetical protein